MQCRVGAEHQKAARFCGLSLNNTDERIDPADIHPLFFGYRASPDTRRLIVDCGAWLAFPKGMIVPG
jgi:hypothetical protein